MGRNQYWAGRVYDLCVYYMTGTPEGSTESGFMEKPGIEPTRHSAYPLHHGGFSTNIMAFAGCWKSLVMAQISLLLINMPITF